MDYIPFRDRKKQAVKLKEEIANAADNLVNLIRQFEETGVIGPIEFHSVPELLRKTDNNESRGHNLDMWRAMRPYVLGDRPRHDVPEKELKQQQGNGESVQPPEIVIRFLEPDEKLEIHQAEQARANLRYGWGVSPSLPALLDTVATAAREFKPSEYGMVDAAVDSRQHSEKTEYLRAFANLLINVHNFTLTTTVMKAMAIVANVAINLPNVDVSYDDVRKAIAKLSSELLENSKGK